VTQTTDNKSRSHAALQNVRSMMELVRKLQGRRPHLPNIGVMHGPSGYGKSQAAIYAQNKTRGVRVEVGDSWTRKTLMRSILLELGAVPKGTTADMVEHAVQLLGEEIDRPLFIDEADKLVDKGMIELVREVAECSQAPVILIGEEALPTKLARVERVHNRVLDWAAAEPCDLEDTRKLAVLYVPQLTLTDNLLDTVRVRSQGRARRVVTNLDHIAEWARNLGVALVDETYDGRFFTGDAPRPRDPGKASSTLRRAA
jgi:DNA transposition AAA+ family ATPase